MKMPKVLIKELINEKNTLKIHHYYGVVTNGMERYYIRLQSKKKTIIFEMHLN
jgi:hypothetical protein